MNQTGSIDVILIYNLLNFLFTAVGMFVSAAVVHRFNSGIVSVLGIICYNLLYLQLILLNDKSADFVVLLGITSGLAGSFYWISYSQRLTEYTDLSNRDTGMAIINIVFSVVNAIAPLLAGIIISSVGGFKGYETVFGIAFVVAIITAIGAIRLPQPKSERVHVVHGKAVKMLFKSKVILFSAISEFFKGIREGAFAFILSILLYRLIKNEALVGFNNLLSSIATTASFIFMSRRIRGENRIKYMKTAVFWLLGSSILCTAFLNPFMLIVFTIISSFFSGFIVSSSFSTFLDAIQILPEIKNMRPEYFAIKEVFLAAGRCLGIMIIMIIDKLSTGSLIWMSFSLVILTATQFGTVVFCRKAMEQIKEISTQRCD
jgi:MFS family permease